MLTTPQRNQKHLYPVVPELEESTLQYIQHEYGNINHAASALQKKVARTISMLGSYLNCRF